MYPGNSIPVVSLDEGPAWRKSNGAVGEIVQYRRLLDYLLLALHLRTRLRVLHFFNGTVNGEVLNGTVNGDLQCPMYSIRFLEQL